MKAGLRIVATTVIAGIGAGLVGAVLTLMLHGVQWLAFGYPEGPGHFGANGAPDWRRVVAPVLGGLIAGLGWWWVRTRLGFVQIRDVIADPTRRLPLRSTGGDALLQIVLVGSGASLGREAAPREAAAALADSLGRRLRLDGDWQRLVVAGAAGAGLASVYNVPFAGAVFTVEIVLHLWRRTSAVSAGGIVERWLAPVVIAAVMSALGTVAAWPVVTTGPTFQFPRVSLDGPTLLLALAAVAAASLAGIVMAWTMGRARRLARPRSKLLPVVIGAAGLATGLVAVGLPWVTGNGKAIIQLALDPVAPVLVTFALLAVAKLTLTAGYLASGANGGLLMPAMALGAATAAVVALAAGGRFETIALLGLLGGVVVLSITQQAPVFAGVFGWELTHAQPLVGLLCLAAAGIGYGVDALTRLGWGSWQSRTRPTIG